MRGDAAAREVDRRLGERLVERRARGAEAAHSGAVAERGVEGLAERDRAVLDGVVLVDPEIALAAQLDVGERPEREAREHVVEEAEAGRDARAPAAEEPERAVDARLARGAPHLADAVAADARVGRRAPRRRRARRAPRSRWSLARRVRDRDAEAVGQQRLVRERAHGAAARSASWSNTSGTAERASTKLPASARPRRPRRACPRPGEPRSSTIAAQRSRSSSTSRQASSATAADQDEIEPGRAQRVERLASAGCAMP